MGVIVEKTPLPKLQPVKFLLNWGRRYSLWVMNFGLACCAIELIATSTSKHDFIRLGVIPFAHGPRQADLLVVGLNSDAGVRTLKGPTRPINEAAARAAVLAGLEAVDYLTIFDETTPLELVRAVRPDVLVKGADYRREEVVGGDFVESCGGRVHLAGLRDGYSTTRLLQRLGAA